MLSFALKTLISALIIALASELAKRSTLLGALIIGLPLNSILALSLLYIDTRDPASVASFSRSILFLIIPSLIYFLLLPFGMRQGLGYWPATGIAAFGTVIGYGVWIALLRVFGLGV
jgi:hypothetical protein